MSCETGGFSSVIAVRLREGFSDSPKFGLQNPCSYEGLLGRDFRGLVGPKRHRELTTEPQLPVSRG